VKNVSWAFLSAKIMESLRVRYIYEMTRGFNSQEGEIRRAWYDVDRNNFVSEGFHEHSCVRPDETISPGD